MCTVWLLCFFTYRLVLYFTYLPVSIGLMNYHISNNILHVTEEELPRVEALSLTQEWLRNSVGCCEHMEKLKLRNFLYCCFNDINRKAVALNSPCPNSSLNPASIILTYSMYRRSYWRTKMKFFIGKRDKIASFWTMLMSKILVFGKAVLSVSLNDWCEMPLCLQHQTLSSPPIPGLYNPEKKA